jgi:hypothetical protein
LDKPNHVCPNIRCYNIHDPSKTAEEVELEAKSSGVRSPIIRDILGFGCLPIDCLAVGRRQISLEKCAYHRASYRLWFIVGHLCSDADSEEGYGSCAAQNHHPQEYDIWDVVLVLYFGRGVYIAVLGELYTLSLSEHI